MTFYNNLTCNKGKLKNCVVLQGEGRVNDFVTTWFECKYNGHFGITKEKGGQLGQIGIA